MKQPVLIPANDSQFVLLEEYIYTWESEGQRQCLVIAPGFVTDIASVPRFAWTLTGIQPDGLHRAAAVVHDLLYQWRGLPQWPSGRIQTWDNDQWRDTEIRWTREACDELFRQLMTEAGAAPWRIRTMFWAVRCFGSPAWNA
jgi:Protein of unknown function (DUF1353)